MVRSCNSVKNSKLLSLSGPPKMKRPMETNRLETGPPVAKRMCLAGSKQVVSPAIPTVTTSAGTVASTPVPTGKLVLTSEF